MTQHRPVLFFDLDDTLLSFSAGKPDFLRDAFALHGAPLDCGTDEFMAAVGEVVGPYWRDPVRAARGRRDLVLARREVVALIAERLGAKGVSAACNQIADTFTALKEEAVCPLPRAIETLAILRDRGIRLGLITNGSADFQRRKLERYNLEGIFESILIEGEWTHGKPDASIYVESLRRLNVAANEAWMIGDNIIADIGGAQSVGLKTVWVDHAGDGVPQHAPAKPDIIVSNVSQLLDGILPGLF